MNYLSAKDGLWARAQACHCPSQVTVSFLYIIFSCTEFDAFHIYLPSTKSVRETGHTTGWFNLLLQSFSDLEICLVFYIFKNLLYIHGFLKARNSKPKSYEIRVCHSLCATSYPIVDTIKNPSITSQYSPLHAESKYQWYSAWRISSCLCTEQVKSARVNVSRIVSKQWWRGI